MSMLRSIKTLIFEAKTRLRYPELGPSFAVNSHLTNHERVKLFSLSGGAKNIVEIGSYVGASACCFGAAAEKFGHKKIICIDTWNNDAMSEGSRDTWSEFSMNTGSYRKYLFPVRGFSTDVVDDVRKLTSTVDLLFIDGDHSYGGVKADWDAYKQFLAPGAIVVFHDYGWAEGVQRVVQEDVIPLMSKYDRLPNMWWGTLAEQP
jgi:predicted O-methyltransferase YrrM